MGLPAAACVCGAPIEGDGAPGQKGEGPRLGAGTPGSNPGPTSRQPLDLTSY